MNRRTINLFDVKIDDVTLPEALDIASDWLRTGGFHHIVTPGPEFLLESTANPPFRTILNNADLSLPDGTGLLLAARATKKKLRSRVTGVDFLLGLMSVAEKNDYRVFLFGSSTSVVQGAATELQKMYPQLKIVGAESGWRGPWQKLHNRQLIEKIHLAKPDILLVALGAPKQEFWIQQHRQALHHVSIAIGVGRSFDYLSGSIKRAPTLVRKFGLEWLHTLLFAHRYYQPHRRRQRIMNATWHFTREFLKRYRHESTK